MNNNFLLAYVICSTIIALYACFRWSAACLRDASMKLFLGITGIVGVFIALKLAGFI
jgi:hypothetical protein